MKKHSIFLKTLLVWSVFFSGYMSNAQTDTLKLMTYNVLYYGDVPSCQGPHDVLHGYLKTIIGYTRPDVAALVKLAAPVQDGNPYATAPKGWADSILKYAMNAAIPGRYAYAPFTNEAKANNIELLVYNQEKLGYVSTIASYSNITDMNTYKLYYKDPNLARTHDTTFIYFAPHHIKSGDDAVEVREAQIKAEMQGISKHFTHLPNFIDLGDFNVRGSEEPFYQQLCFPDDTAFRFYDPPFYDHNLKYPAKWDHDAVYAKYFTTSTRVGEYPNPCGTGGGAKNWYDHIFMSPWVMTGANYVKYIPNSYRTIGNNGVLYKMAINNGNPANTSAPAEVIEALFRFSNKYPVMADLLVTQNTSGNSPKDPEIPAAMHTEEHITLDEVSGNSLTAHFTAGLAGQEMTIEVLDANGASQMKKSFKVKGTEKSFPFKMDQGIYIVRFCTVHSVEAEIKITKK